MGLKKEQCAKIVCANYYVKKRVKDLGISGEYIAYYYLVDILDVLINEDKRVHSFSKEIYPFLAKKYNKSDCTVERDIRNVINIFWNDKMRIKLNPYWDVNTKPTCCKFIYLIRNYLLNEIA